MTTDDITGEIGTSVTNNTIPEILTRPNLSNSNHDVVEQGKIYSYADGKIVNSMHGTYVSMMDSTDGKMLLYEVYYECKEQEIRLYAG